jgi:hypothetical protein
VLLAPASSPAKSGCTSSSCKARIAKKQAVRAAGIPWCYATWGCVNRARKRHPKFTLPYPGPGGTRWAIPWRIVACESGGSWGAYNPSGAAGPYQIMAFWGRPFPANTAAARWAHHRIAARLWQGGAGASHWVCK